ncbi:hypothetical protein JZU48_02515, partial [bacterium]|nr:hypothetical protein [bacterium]
CYAKFSLERYIGAPITVAGRLFGTVSFTSPQSSNHEFDEGDVEFVGLLARWMGGVLERDAAYQELARSNAELEQFAYVASHDLREPLRQVSSYVTLLERHLADKSGDLLDDDAREFMAVVRRGATRMNRLILDLLEYSRLGRIERPTASVALSHVADDAIGCLADVIRDGDAEVAIPDRLPDVVGDHDELVRLFQNLIGNAIKYRHPDRPPAVTVAVERDGSYWKVSVSDNGIGIAPEHFERIFRIFQRLHGHGRYEGTGIGLASAKKIVERLGGRIWLESEVDLGSTFFFTLPATPGT